MSFGPPRDVDGECGARLYVADDYGDGECTIRCSLKPHHEEPHRQTWNRDGAGRAGVVVVTWRNDESVLCEKHGRKRPESNGKCARCWIDEIENE